MTLPAALSALIEHKDLSHNQMLSLMRAIMTGEFTPAQIAGLLMALRVKGETATEIAAATEVMRELSTRVTIEDAAHLIDTCGTGGDSAHTFNVSTTCAFVAAAAGAKVAKHGGRSVSSTCGSADVLEALDINVNLPPEAVARCVDEIGIGFMFAPNHHSAMKYAAPVRKELGVRTLFNLLGPMTNPAGARKQIMGVFHRDLVTLLVHTLRLLGSEHVLTVHGADGMDEISITGETYVAELKDGEVREYTLHPEQFGIGIGDIHAIQVNNPIDAKNMLLAVLDNQPGAARDIVLLNAGAAIYVAGLAPSLEEGVDRARLVLERGLAKQKLAQLIECTNRMARA
jgi:anthranilate phosphoribosyltransferase